jgi:hypothetical protein
MERQSHVCQQLTEMQKTLQLKLMGLYTRRDSLHKSIQGSAAELDKEEYELLERQVHKLQEQC